MMEKKEPCERNRSGAEVTQMDLSHQDLMESSGMLKEVAVSSLLLLLSNSGMAGEVPEDRRAVSMAGVLKGREKSKRLGSLISMPGMILKEISKLLLEVTLRFCPTQPYDLYCDINWFILLYKSYLTYNPQAP